MHILILTKIKDRVLGSFSVQRSAYLIRLSLILNINVQKIGSNKNIGNELAKADCDS